MDDHSGHSHEDDEIVIIEARPLDDEDAGVCPFCRTGRHIAHAKLDGSCAGHELQSGYCKCTWRPGEGEFVH